MDISSPISRKRANSESSPTKSPKMCKVVKSFKENIPPEGYIMYSPRRTPGKCSEVKGEPITPNANIKLLTSLAASLDYANICNTPKSSRSEEVCLEESNEEDILLGSEFKPSRKEKSLALVCFKFLAIYPLDPDPSENITVSLDEASYKLKVERRRLYDIVNVFESIEMLSKVAKNRYVWYGRKNLLKALIHIKNSAVCEGVERKLKYVHDSESSSNYLRHSCILDEVQEFTKKLEEENESVKRELLTPNSPHPEARKEKSLASMSQKFLMLFLVSPSKIISLSEAAKVLNGFQKYNKGAQIKTQIRRLYDIANVLSSIDLIQKLAIKGNSGKKPAFKYIGPDINAYNNKENVQSRLSKKLKPRSLIRHSSFQEICAVAELEHQKLCLEEAPKSAPPFETSLTKEPHFVNFSVLDTKSSSCLKTNKLSSALQTIQPVISNNTTSVKPTKIPIAKSPKIMNARMPVIAKKGSYFIVNQNISIPYSQPGTVFVLNKYVPPKNSQKETVIKKSDGVASSQTIELSSSQRDSILKSLNISLSSGQVAAIQLAGATQSSNSASNNQCNVLKIINPSNIIASKDTKQSISLKLDSTKCIDTENEGSSTANSTRNNSPISENRRNYSPLSIPSGYATPIPTSMSDITSFPSNSEVDSILKKIENGRDTPSASEGSSRVEGNPNKQNTVPQTFRNFMPIKGCDLLPRHNSDSCSSESLNSEVSNIMREASLGEIPTVSRPHSFLIDEKTILSPIKKPDGSVKVLSPSPLMTPPYIGTDAIFAYQPFIKLQNTTGNRLEASVEKLKTYSLSSKIV